MSSNNLNNFIVSIISDKPQSVFDNLNTYKNFGIRGLHFDAMDGLFVPRLGLHPELLSNIKQSTDMFVEIHMMLQKPSFFVDTFINAGADRFIFHYETEDNFHELRKIIRDQSLEVGIALNPQTPIENIFEHLENVDCVTVMAIQPGIPRHPFLEETYEKIARLFHFKNSNGLDFQIEIDGGITFENSRKLLDMGVDLLVAGSGTVFNSINSLEHNLLRLTQL